MLDVKPDCKIYVNFNLSHIYIVNEKNEFIIIKHVFSCLIKMQNITAQLL
jgi:hypothetical protein